MYKYTELISPNLTYLEVRVEIQGQLKECVIDKHNVCLQLQNQVGDEE